MKKDNSLIQKICLVFVISVLAGLYLNGQDIILKKNGEEIKAKVAEVLDKEVKYRKADNLTGPIYSILKTEVFMIKYENGTKDVFNEQPVAVIPEKTPEKKISITSDDLKPAKNATIIGGVLVVPILALGITSGAIWDNPELTIPMGAAATLIGAVGIPIVAGMSKKTRELTGVEGNSTLRLAGWISYGLALSDAVIILSLAAGGTDTSGGPTYSVAVIGSIASILMALDANQTYKQGKSLVATSHIQPMIGTIKDNLGRQYTTAGVRINF